ncbi:MAG: GtrA family protein [Erysipelotrichia bacterium]|nr:GtrA family protein [Erysipelotrichia bacterium]
MLKKQIIMFIFTGIINTIFGYAMYALFIYLGCQYIFASGLATVLGILFNFKTISKFVFKANENRLIFKFFGVYSLVFITNIILIKVFKDFGFNEYLAGLVATFPCAIMSFILNKFYVFKEGLGR